MKNMIYIVRNVTCTYFYSSKYDISVIHMSNYYDMFPDHRNTQNFKTLLLVRSE